MKHPGFLGASIKQSRIMRSIRYCLWPYRAILLSNCHEKCHIIVTNIVLESCLSSEALDPERNGHGVMNIERKEER
jgi:hypothetical protein